MRKRGIGIFQKRLELLGTVQTTGSGTTNETWAMSALGERTVSWGTKPETSAGSGCNVRAL